jgi:8-oxo-dGTP diphosphatase
MNNHQHSQTICADNGVLLASDAESDAVAEVSPIAAATTAGRAADEMHVIPARGSDTRSYKLIGDVHLLLLDSADRTLFGLRRNTGLMDGTYHLPAGHLEAGESVVEAVIREAKEELGVTIDPEHVEFAHVMHSPLTGGRASFFFCVRQWKGIPANREPHKCSELRWFRLDELPDAMISYCRVALKHIATGNPFSVCGWEAQPDPRYETDCQAAERLDGPAQARTRMPALTRAM